MAIDTEVITDQDLREITGISIAEEAKNDEVAKKQLEEALIAVNNNNATPEQEKLAKIADIVLTLNDDAENLRKSEKSDFENLEASFNKPAIEDDQRNNVTNESEDTKGASLAPVFLPPEIPKESPPTEQPAQKPTTKPSVNPFEVPNNPSPAPIPAINTATTPKPRHTSIPKPQDPPPAITPSLPSPPGPLSSSDSAPDIPDDILPPDNSGNGDGPNTPPTPVEQDPPYIDGQDYGDQEVIKYSFTVAEQTSDIDNKGFLYLKRRQEEFTGRGRTAFTRFMRRGLTVFGGASFRKSWSRDFVQTIRENEGLVDAPLEESYGLDAAEARSQAEEAKNATLERVANGYLAQGADEKGVALAEDDSSTDQLRQAIKSIALRYADGEISDDQVIAERDRLFGQIDGLNPELFSESAYTIDDLRALLCDVRADIEHGMARDRVETALDNITLRGAITHSTARTQHRAAWLDKLEGHTRVSVLGAGSAAMLGAGLAMDLTRRGAMSSVGAAVRVATVGFVSGAVLAGVQAAYGFRRDASFARQEHTYDVDNGLEGHKKRQQTAEILHNTEYAPDIIQSLRATLGENDRFIDEMDKDGLVAITQAAQRIRTLMSESDTRGIDFIRFSGISQAAVERYGLMRTLDEIEVATAAYLVAHGQEIMPIDLDQQNAGDVTLEVAIRVSDNMIANSTRAILEQDVDLRSANYRNLMIRRAAVGALIGGVTAGIVGVGMQEAIAGASSGLAGAAEFQTPGTPNTMLNSIIFGQQNGPNPVVGNSVSSTANTYVVTHPGSQINLTIPDTMNAKFAPGNPNSFDLISKQDGSVVAQNIETLPNGEISPASLRVLSNEGFSTGQQGTIVNGPPKHVGPNSFASFYSKETEQLHYVAHNTNGEPGLIGDYNELSMRAGGVNDSWHTANGNVKVSLDDLTADGSWHGSHHVNVLNALKDGKVKLTVGVTDHHNPQGKLQAFSYDFKQNKQGEWSAIIPKNSPVHSWFGPRLGNGGESEGYHGPGLDALRGRNGNSLNSLSVVVDHGPNAKGVHEVESIASIPGEGKTPYEVPTQNKVVTSWILPPTAEVEGGTVPAVGPPIYVPGGMGLGKRGEKPQPYYDRHDYDSYISPEEIDLIRSEISPRMLRGDSLDLEVEAAWYRTQLEANLGPEYLSEISGIAARSTGLSTLPIQTKALVTIPVSAVGESENIYKTLSLYAQQQNVSSGEASIILGVNNIEGQRNNPDDLVKIERTLAEIERAKRDFPDINIVVVDFELPREILEERQRNGDGVIGDITRRLYDITALSAGEHAGKADSEQDDILIIRNDADALGLSPVYLNRMLQGLRTMPDAMAFRGETLFGVGDAETRSKLPGLSFAMNFESFLVSLGAKTGRLNTAGANFGIKASVYTAMGGLGSSFKGGAGSDDVRLGERMKIATGLVHQIPPGNAYYNSPAQHIDSNDSDRSIDSAPVRFVGASLDTNPMRQIASYISGGNPAYESWRNFSDGSNGARPRNADIDDVKIKKESFSKTIENTERLMSQMLRGVDRGMAEYYLGRFLGSVSRFRITSDNDGRLQVRLTDSGKDLLKRITKNRISDSDSGIIPAKYRRLMRDGASPLQRFVRPINQ